MVTPNRVPTRPRPLVTGAGPNLPGKAPHADRHVPILADFPAPPADLHALEVRSLLPFGLSSREARLYLALLQSGPVGAGEASKQSGLHRATGYRVLARLLARGLVKGDGRWPQRFHGAPAQVLCDRMAWFLQDEIELRKWSVGMYPQAAAAPVQPKRDGRVDRRLPASGELTESNSSSRARMVSWGSVSSSVPLSGLRAAKRSVDAFLRPGTIPPPVRNALATALADASSQGVAIRLVLDHAVADQRFVDRLWGDPKSRSLGLDVRRYTPLAGHLYVVDGRMALRFPTLSCLVRGTDIGLASQDPEFVQAQVDRFESVWVDATASLGALGSTRSFGWRDPNRGLGGSAPRLLPSPIKAAGATGRSLGEVRYTPS
jgi:Sugar-specific transcriptional regulator TrmB